MSDSGELAYRTNFERTEVKYWVTEAIADRITLFARPYLEPDPWSRGGKLSRNTSLYLDTRGFICHQLHVQDAPTRWKLRVRAYGTPPAGVAFFEVKYKVKSITLKRRANLPIEEVGDTLLGRKWQKPARKEDRENLDAFLYLQRVHRVEPQVLIGAFRQAYVSRLGEDVRLTIDREIAYQPTSSWQLDPKPYGWVTVPGPDERSSWYSQRRALVELKFGGRAPEWMSELVAHFELKRVGFSKYVSAVNHWLGLPQ